MKMFNSYHTLLLLATALVLAFVVPLKAQDTPQDYLSAHNRLRATVRVGPLVWSEKLATYARSYAMRRSDCRPVLSNGPYGEVIAFNTALDLSAAQVVNMIESQRTDYNYDTNTCRVGRSCEGYTQAVWRNSVSLGCAKVRCDAGGSLTVCNYDPRGNVPGQRPY